MKQPIKQSSANASTIAARVLRMTNAEMVIAMADQPTNQDFCDSIRTLAASVMSQDETRGK